MAGFIKYIRSEESEFLLGYPSANHLFMVMAYRARRTDHPMNGLKAGQCFLGDYSAIGLTERQYRTAKKQLSDWGLATFKGTNKGTVGTILNTKVYDINDDRIDGQSVTQETDKGRASDGQETTNKECKKEKNDKEENKSLIKDAFLQFWGCYHKKQGKAQAEKAFISAVKREGIKNIDDFTDMLIKDCKGRISFGQFGFDKLNASTYLNNNRWEDEVIQEDIQDDGGNITDWSQYGIYGWNK